MRRVCAWCNEDFERAAGIEDEAVTHGICVQCEAFLAANQPTSLRGLINRLDVPVLCVSTDMDVLAANDAAGTLLGRDAAEIGDCLCGELLECAWSRKAEGCGRTEHCVACAIRRTVSETHASGMGVSEQHAYLDHVAPEGSTRVSMTLSTEKLGDIVLVRIDQRDAPPHS